jgi:hypothetical protein
VPVDLQRGGGMQRRLVIPEVATLWGRPLV